MEKLFDSHAHYYDTRFEAMGGAHPLLTRLFEEGVEGIVNVGTDLENAAEVLALAAAFPRMYAAIGIHPTDGQGYKDPEAALQALEVLADVPEVAIIRLNQSDVVRHDLVQTVVKAYDAYEKKRRGTTDDAQ